MPTRKKNNNHTMKVMTWMKLVLFSQHVLAYPLPVWNRKTPIVFATECENLKTQLAEISCGNRFLLMTDMSSDSHMTKTPMELRDNLRFLLQLSFLVQYSSGKPITQLDTTFTQYLSDENRLRYSSHDEVVQGLNLVRAFLQGGMGDISHYPDWILAENRLYQKRSREMEKCIRFLKTFPIRQPLTIDNYHVGHALGVLPYEKQMTRNDSISGKMYACSSHFLWVKDADPLSLEYLSSIENPLGIVVHDHTSIDQLLENIQRLNPSRQAGKITFLLEMNLIQSKLPPLLDRIQKEEIPVSWCCHPIGSSLCSIHANLHHFLSIFQRRQLPVGGIFLSMKQYSKQDILSILLDISNFLQASSSSTLPNNPTWNRFSL